NRGTYSRNRHSPCKPSRSFACAALDRQLCTSSSVWARCYEVISHSKRRGRPVLDKGVEQEEDRFPDCTVALQLQRPSVNMPLQQDFEQEHGISLLEHRLRIPALK